MIKPILLLCAILFQIAVAAREPGDTLLLPVKRCAPFILSESAINPAWNTAEWNALLKLDSGGIAYTASFKILYAEKGVYVLFHATDKKITTTYVNDFENLFKGDVFEVFFQPDAATPIYIEYEINQLNKELVLLVPNLSGRAHGWIPWHYEKNRRVQKIVHLSGGESKPGETIGSWTVELFFPFELFSPLGNIPPKSGTTWKANFYRLDYDSGKMIKWAWSPVERSFHEFARFGTLVFE